MPVCILGMHRSGTSMITRLLHVGGLYLGPDDAIMRVLTEDNPEGYWENQKITDFNDELLRQLGGTWDNPPDIQPGWSQGAAFKLFSHRLRALLAGFDEHPYWGWKDPRNTLTLEFWLNAIPDLKLVLCLRNPLEVARSLSTGLPMRELAFDDALALWTAYHRRLLTIVEADRLIVTHYESYFYDGHAELRRLYELLGMEVPGETLEQALATVKRDLKHYNLPNLVLDRRVSPELAQSYQGFCVLAGSTYRRMVDDIGYQYSGLERYTRQLLADWDASSQRNAQLEINLSSLQAEIAGAREYTLGLENNLARRETELAEAQDHLRRLNEQLQAEVTQAGEKVAALENSFSQRETELAEAQDHLRRLNEQLQIEAIQASEKVAALENSLSQRETELAEAQDHLRRLNEQLQVEVTQASEKVAALENSLSQREAELAEAQDHLRRLNEQLQIEVTQAGERVAALEASLSQREAELAEAQDHLRLLNDDLVQQQEMAARYQSEIKAQAQTIEEQEAAKGQLISEQRTALANLNAEIQRWRNHTRELEAHTDTLRTTLNSREREIGDLRGQFDRANLETLDLQQRVDSLGEQLAAAQQQAAYWQHEFDTMRQSLMVRLLARPVWYIRRKLIPDGSKRYLRYRRIRRRTGIDDAEPGREPFAAQPLPVKAGDQPAPSRKLDKTQLAFASREDKPVVICTIASKNYLAQVRTLVASLREHHRGSDIHLVCLLVDRLDGYFDPDKETFETILAEEIRIPRWEHFSMKYSIMELNTAVKPFLLEYLFERFNAQKVIYFDPDIIVFRPLDELLALLDDYNLVLTPHLLDPIDDGRKPSELEIIRSGTYNLGFVAFARSEQSLKLIQWWQEKLYNHCVVALEDGIFVDQSWMNMAPALVERTWVLRDPGYNVAYWNIKTRHLEHDGSGYRVNGSPLTFFHFSGYSPDLPEQVSKHQDRYKMSELNSAYQAMFADYTRRLARNGHNRIKNWPYAYGEFLNGVLVTPLVRVLLREHDLDGTRWPNPYDVTTPGNFFDWITLPANGPTGRYVSYYALEFYRRRLDLPLAFPDVTGAAELAFAQWLANTPENADWLLPAYVEPIRAALRKPAQGTVVQAVPVPPVQKIKPKAILDTAGVNLIGFAYSETGVGQLLRNTASALDLTSYPFAVHVVEEHDGSRKQDRVTDQYIQGIPYARNVFFVNADMTFTVQKLLDPDVYNDHYNIALWNWELSSFPERWTNCFDLYDEIWVASTFIQAALASRTTKPVTCAPIAIERPPNKTQVRAQLGLADDQFVALFVFDALSIVERKNPWAVIEAFRKAFSAEERRHKAKLVIKVSNLDRFPEEAARLQDLVSSVDGHLLASYMDRPVVDALIRDCDVYLSLHRAEGFGLTIAEAMFYGKPVITTGYSGNMDFTKATNSYLVPYQLAELGREYTPYEANNVWAEPDTCMAADMLRHVYENPEEGRQRGSYAADYIHHYHNQRVVGEAVTRLLTVNGAGN